MTDAAGMAPIRRAKDRPLGARMLVAALIMAAALLLRPVLLPNDSHHAFVTLYPAMVWVFWSCGIWPGSLTSVIAAAFGIAWFHPSARTLQPHQDALISAASFFATVLPVGLLLHHQAGLRQALGRQLAAKTAVIATDLIGIAKVYDRRIAWANLGLERLLGYAPGDLAGLPTRVNFPDDASWEAFGKSAYPILAAGGEFHTELLLARKDGGRIWVKMSGQAMHGQPGMSLWTFVDITRSKAAETALHTSETLLRRTGAIAHVGGWQVDAGGKTVLWTDETCRMHDVPPGTCPAVADAIEYYTPSSRPQIEQALREALANGTPFDLELELVSAKGRRFWARATGAAEMHGGRVIRVNGAFQDITDRRKAALALGESEARLKLALDSAGVGAWSLDLEAGTVWHDATTAAFFGQTQAPEQTLPLDGPVMQAALARICPEDRYTYRHVWAAFAAGELGELDTHCRVRASQGIIRSLAFRGVARDRDRATGKYRRALGLVWDVTEAEAVARRLRESEAAARRHAVLLNSAYGAARAGLCFVDHNLRIVEINDFMAACFGRSARACIGKTGAELGHCYVGLVEDHLRRVIETGQALENVEFRMARPSDPDMPRDWLMNVHPVFDETGAVAGAGQAVFDITPRKRMEEALLQANRDLETLARLDSLTRLANRRWFDEALMREFAAAERSGFPLSLVLADIDGFKLFNDNYGHQSGDACLSAVSLALAQCVRRPADLVARFGGEEFSLLLPATDAAGAEAVAERARAAIEALGLPHAHNPAGCGIVTASFGVATLDRHEEGVSIPAATLVGAADRLLYQAKQSGRNRVCAGGIKPTRFEEPRHRAA